MIKTALISIAKKLVKWDKTLAIYRNGEDNAYPERMERFRNNSVTASMASNIMVQYLIGKGFGQFDNIMIGDQKFIEVAEDIARELVLHEGVFIHENFDANFDLSDFKTIPFNDCRVGEKDSKDYNGKILVSKQWGESKIDKSKVQVLNVSNPDKKVIEYQVEKSGGIDKYNGQIYYYNSHRQYYYPLSRIDAVALDCDNEYQASIYKNEILRRGFFGKTLVVTRPLVNESFIKSSIGSSEYNKELKEMESEREMFKETIKDFISVGNVGGVLHMEVDFAGDDINNAILFKNIESNINDKLFEYTEKSCVEKILMAFNNLPIALIKSPDSALLGNSGEALKEAQRMYWKNTSKERAILESILTDRYNRMNPENKTEIRVLPLLEEDTSVALMEKQKAQSNLKGSVGGVTSLLEIIKSVSDNITDYNSGLSIIQEIFGFSEETARELLGTPNQINNN